MITGICSAVYKPIVKAYGGDKYGETCIFPFDYKGLTFNSCVDQDTVMIFITITTSSHFSGDRFYKFLLSSKLHYTFYDN